MLEERVFSGAVVGRGLFLIDKRGRIRGSFSLTDDDRPSFYMGDSDGKMRLYVSLLEDGSPRVELCDASGVGSVILGAGDSVMAN